MEFKKRNIKIYIISGKAHSGKDTIAKYIINKLNHKKVITLTYASYLKMYAANILGWDGSEDTKPRDFLQNIGVELIKNQIDDKFLINRIIEDIKVYSYFYDVVIIGDARFPDEIENIKSNFNNVTVIRIDRDNNNLTNEQKNHSTEVSLDNYNGYDYVVDNSKDLDSLYKELDKILEVSYESSN
ncbi:MAG: hypothetical protein IJ565_00675 [Bacilli bacterium]|nr:hypothetical protein [Bacilli bacterium]